MAEILERGLDMSRAIQAMIAAKSAHTSPSEFAALRWGPQSRPALLMKAAVTAATITDADWAGPLADQASVPAQFFGLVRERSVLGKIGFMRRLPLVSRLVAESQGATGYWVAEGKAKPVCEMKFSESALKPRKAASLVVISADLATHADPQADILIRDSLVGAIVETVDSTFLSDDAGDGDKPAGIANGVTAVASTGDPEADLAALIADFTGDAETATIVASGKVLAHFSGALHPDVTARGGTLGGYSAVASKFAGDQMFMLDGAGLGLAAGAIEIDTSTEGSVQLESAPGEGAAAIVSLWQNNLVGLKCEQIVNWARGRAGAVSFISGITYP